MRVKIEDLGINGEGVARITDAKANSKVCFVPFALPEENVEIDIIENKPKFAVCRLTKIYNESIDRVSPKCPYFGICGGCDLQHMSTYKQRVFKKDKIKQTLYRVGHIDTQVSDVIYGSPYKYRNKMVFPIREENGKKSIGMFRKDTREIVEIDKCLIANDIINQVFFVTKKYINNCHYSCFCEKTQMGVLKYLVVRTNGKQVLITMVTTKKIDLSDYLELLKNNFTDIGLSILVNTKDSDIMFGQYYQIYGLEKLNIVEDEIEYGVDNRGFLQVNTEVKEKLYSYVLSHLSRQDYVIDAYSGAGVLSARIAKIAEEVVAIEINSSASNSANELAKKNNIDNMTIVNGDVAIELPKYLGQRSASIVLDPPRSGCEREVLDSIMECSRAGKIRDIIYISCNPATLARDLSILNAEFEIKQIQPFDLFSMTKHIETVAILQYKNK